GREVDGNAPAGDAEARVLDRGPHPLFRLLDGGIGQADGGERLEAAREVDLDLDERAFEADDRAGQDFREHGLPPPSPRLAAGLIVAGGRVRRERSGNPRFDAMTERFRLSGEGPGGIVRGEASWQQNSAILPS